MYSKQERYDQHLTKVERAALKEAFDSIDKDSDGVIDEFELKKLLEEMGEKPSFEDIFKMMNEVNPDDNKGFIDWDDWLHIMCKSLKNSENVQQ